MGSDMHMNPPSREEKRNWAGKGDIINQGTGEIIQGHLTTRSLPVGFVWADTLSSQDFIRALIVAKQGSPATTARGRINRLQNEALNHIVKAVEILNNLAQSLEVAEYDSKRLRDLYKVLDDRVTEQVGMAESKLRDASVEAKSL